MVYERVRRAEAVHLQTPLLVLVLVPLHYFPEFSLGTGEDFCKTKRGGVYYSLPTILECQRTGELLCFSRGLPKRLTILRRNLYAHSRPLLCSPLLPHALLRCHRPLPISLLEVNRQLAV